MNRESNQPLFTTGKCTICDEWAYRGMSVIWMENDFLKIGILAGRGSDIFEFRYKPLNIDFMLRLTKGILNPQIDFSQMRNTTNQFEDYYYGGWQEILPNTPAFKYRGASLGQHGEISLIPWKYAILNDSPEKVSVKLWVKPLRLPIRIEKTLTMIPDEATLYIAERLSNESNTHLDIIWGHHVAFGLPFLREGGIVETSAKKMRSEPAMPDHRRFKSGIETNWPYCTDIKNKQDQANIIPPAAEFPYSELSYLYDFDDKGTYTLKHAQKNIGFTLNWDAAIFKCLWFWQERYATQDAPWWGDVYAVALEPWTSMWRSDAQESIAAGEWLKLERGQTISTKLSATITHD